MNREALGDLLGFAPSDEQWAAISAPVDGPMLILAGAGSGKTAVMSARVVWLVATGAVAPDQVLGLTFTNKAAGELSQRIRSLLKRLQSPTEQESADPTIATFHSFAMDLVSAYGLLIGAEPSASLLSPTDLAVSTYRAVARSSVNCEELGTSVIKTVCDRVQALDEELCEHLVSPADLRAHDQRLIDALSHDTSADARRTRDAARKRIVATRVVEQVRADRSANAVVGFADLMRLAVEVTRVSHVRDQLRERFAVVLVDEYQDTSVAQRMMLQNLFSEGFPVTAVGDPLQAIYGWRGASVANIDGFPEHFTTTAGHAPTRTLSINRRSGSLILDVANAVASDVRAQHPDVQILQPADDQLGQVTAALFDTWAEEVGWVVGQIREQIAEGRALDQIAVLCRTNDYVRLVAQELRESGIPTAAASLGSILHLPEVVEVLSVLRVLETGDNGALVRLLTGPKWRIGPSDLAVLGTRSRSLVGHPGEQDPDDFDAALRNAVAEVDPVDVVSLLEAVYDPGPAVSAQARDRLRDFAASLDAMRPVLMSGVEEAAHRVVESSGLGVEVRLGPNAASRIDGLAALFDVIATYRSSHDDPSVGAFLRWLDFAEQLDETPDTDFPIRGEAVRVMTVHRAKGLEWECVLVPGLSAGVFPSSQGRSMWTTSYQALPYPLRGDRRRLPALAGWTATGGRFSQSFKKLADELKRQYKEHDRWEENRLAYVALTRARDVLFTSGHWWSAGGQRREPSPYLLAIADVAGVGTTTWLEQASEDPSDTTRGDIEWPSPHEVLTPVLPPPASQEPLTLAESARLARMDADIEAVIEREYQQSLPTQQVDLPPLLSASLLMRAASDPDALAVDLARPMPYVTPAAAARGTAFHEWVAASHEQLSLVPEWEAAVDAELAVDRELDELIAGYRRTDYASMTPAATETEVMVTIAGIVVRGVIDAVFQHPDGTWDVVDWKTNRAHTADPLQLALYRIGWARRVGVAPEEVLTAFVYVRDGHVVRPELPSLEEIEATIVAGGL